MIDSTATPTAAPRGPGERPLRPPTVPSATESDRLRRRVCARTIVGPEQPFVLASGDHVAPLTIAYETYGRLNGDRANAVLVCHALTGDAHAAGIDESGRAGWWDALIGPGRAIDTDRWFVICSNVIGGCAGSTGPRSQPRGLRFPSITIGDIVCAQKLLLERIGVERLACVAGGSMGAMQALEWAVRFPDHVDRVVAIAAGAAHSPWAIGFASVAREILDACATAGRPERGLEIARQLAMLTYRSEQSLDARFGRSRVGDAASAFQVEDWIRHHGRRLVERFNPESVPTADPRDGSL